MRLIRYSSFFCLLLASSIVTAQSAIQKEIQTKFILAEDGDEIEIREGRFEISSTLSIEGKKNIIIKGAGIGKTVLDFKDQTDGAEGIRISNMKNVTLQDLSVLNASGDAVKAMNVKDVKFLRVETSWEGKPKASNGAYGLYPVMCKGVHIEGCIARGASDAGIYVGQSKNIIVKESIARENVAGIEIENSLNAEVFDNTAIGNTGGILVFDLPDLVQKKGGNVKVFDNHIEANNYKNFAPKGNIVGKVPPGTGVLILATSDVEVYDNLIRNNRTLGIGVISYFTTENPINDDEYDPYPKKISIHDNEFERKAQKTTGKGRFGKMYRLVLKFGKDVPFIHWDGIRNPDDKTWVLCVEDNVNESFVNLDVENNFENVSRELIGCEK
ncbi:parallel beta-helix domain-containing protein [Jiulongibacter sp. NS-SX5]|uniref:parallel beta-helix domain-containing protein n=1 Tax=Jiulongibacter sp. NS-SX5 TaxID=3463854 RepID=UPI00405863D6